MLRVPQFGKELDEAQCSGIWFCTAVSFGNHVSKPKGESGVNVRALGGSACCPSLEGLLFVSKVQGQGAEGDVIWQAAEAPPCFEESSEAALHASPAEPEAPVPTSVACGDKAAVPVDGAEAEACRECASRHCGRWDALLACID